MDDLDLGATIKGFSPGQKIFHRYTLKKILGRGGMGVVWLAHDGELERDVAMKFLPEVVALDPEAVADLKRETRRNLELTHPHIVRIYDFVSGDRTAAITMEYIDGATLSSLKLEKSGRIFSVAELTTWVGQLCAALTYAHTEAQVVHRDLKPANLMIDARGRLKITDFGIARGISDSVSRVSAQAGGSSGTPLYMSPQQMMGEKPSAADDVYALGATLFELLTGKPPFHSGNVFMQVQNKLPPTIADRRRELEVTGDAVPAVWEQTIAACLAKEPPARPASVEEVWQRLSGKAAPSAPTPVTRPVPPMPAAAPPPAKSKAPLFAALAGAVVLLGATGWYFGVHVPEQERLARISLLEEQGRAAEALKLKTEEERAATAAQEKADRERAEATRQANARGGIIVRSSPPGAEVTIGALEHGVAPLTLKEVKLGKYAVKARLEGHEDWTGEIEVKENEFADVTAELVPWSGQLALSADPAGAEVEIRPLVRTAETRRVSPPQMLKLPPGGYEAVFHRAGWLDRTRRVAVERNKTVSLAETYASAAQAPGWYFKAGAGELRAAAEAGDLEARVRLGDRHFFGLDGTVDMRRAYAEYQVALAAKYPAVYSRLGNLLQEYALEPQSWVKSVQMWRDGALAGDAIAIFNWHQRMESRETREQTPVFSAAEVSQAVDRTRQQAEAGDINAMREVAWAYKEGLGIPPDMAESQRWLKAAAEAGDATGMVYYSDELFNQKKTTEGLVWLNKAAEKGLASAQTNLGHLYLGGQGVAADESRAIGYYREAAKQPFIFVMAALAYCYAEGKGVSQDPVEALRWRQLAAESGVPSLVDTLADVYWNGTGTTADPARAVQLYRQAAQWNYAPSLWQLGYAYHQGKGVTQDYAEALRWFQQGADLGEAACMDWLGFIYREGQGAAKDDYRAVEWFRKGAGKNFASSMYWLGMHHAEGRAVAQSESLAVEWFRKSAKAGDTRAQAELKKRNLTW